MLYLGLPWMERMGVVLDPPAKNLTFKRHGVTIQAQLPQERIRQASAAAFKLWHNRSKKQKKNRLEKDQNGQPCHGPSPIRLCASGFAFGNIPVWIRKWGRIEYDS